MAAGQKIIVQKINLNKIKLSRNSRLDIKDEELDGLMTSIKEVGLLQPVGVVDLDDGTFEVCYGNRRFLACSKLGFTNIMAVVHKLQKESDVDLKNLTENIQRRNISIQEIGRYMQILKKEGLSIKEISARLGVTKNYVDNCVAAFSQVPAEFHNDLDANTGTGYSHKTKTATGKISLTVTRKILTAKKAHNLTNIQMNKLFKAAKSHDDFNIEMVDKYAMSLKKGHDDFVERAPIMRRIGFAIIVTDDHYQGLKEKYVDNGPYNSIAGLMKGILRGEKSVRVDVVS